MKKFTYMQLISQKYEPSLHRKALLSRDKLEHIRSKIDNLFANRLIVESLYLAHLKQRDRRWLMHGLRGLQESIYNLDFYGESTWEVQTEILSNIWENIYKQLKFFGFNYQEIDRLVNEIKAYQKIEMLLRERRPPTELPISDFYYLKTCDVRLSRKLITIVAQNSLSMSLNPIWDCYDLASEVCDDLIDLWEDSFDFNCNRFLFQGKIFGDFETRREYAQFLDVIAIRARRLARSTSELGLLGADLIYRWTLKKLDEARILLTCRLKDSSEKLIVSGRNYWIKVKCTQVGQEYFDC